VTCDEQPRGRFVHTRATMRPTVAAENFNRAFKNQEAREEHEEIASVLVALSQVQPFGDGPTEHEPEPWPPASMSIEGKTYSVGSLLGKGVCADVFKGTGPDGAEVALKMLRPLKSGNLAQGEKDAKGEAFEDEFPPRNPSEQQAENASSPCRAPPAWRFIAPRARELESLDELAQLSLQQARVKLVQPSPAVLFVTPHATIARLHAASKQVTKQVAKQAHRVAECGSLGSPRRRRNVLGAKLKGAAPPPHRAAPSPPCSPRARSVRDRAAVVSSPTTAGQHSPQNNDSCNDSPQTLHADSETTATAGATVGGGRTLASAMHVTHRGPPQLTAARRLGAVRPHMREHLGLRTCHVVVPATGVGATGAGEPFAVRVGVGAARVALPIARWHGFGPDRSLRACSAPSSPRQREQNSTVASTVASPRMVARSSLSAPPSPPSPSLLGVWQSPEPQQASRFDPVRWAGEARWDPRRWAGDSSQTTWY
jgi:hypothetical protein